MGGLRHANFSLDMLSIGNEFIQGKEIRQRKELMCLIARQHGYIQNNIIMVTSPYENQNVIVNFQLAGLAGACSQV